MSRSAESQHAAAAAAKSHSHLSPAALEGTGNIGGSAAEAASGSAAGSIQPDSDAAALSPLPAASASASSPSSAAALVPPFNFGPSTAASSLAAPSALDVDAFHPIPAVSPMGTALSSDTPFTRKHADSAAAAAAAEEEDGIEQTDMPPTPSVASLLADAGAEADETDNFGSRARAASSSDGGARKSERQKMDPTLLPSTPSEGSSSMNASPEPPLPQYPELSFAAAAAAAAPPSAVPEQDALSKSFSMGSDAEGERKSQSESDGQLLQSTLAESGSAGLSQISLQRGETEPTLSSPQQRQQQQQQPVSPMTPQPLHHRPQALSSGDETKHQASSASAAAASVSPGTGDFSGMGSNHVAPYAAAQFLSPTPSASSQASSQMRSTSPAAPMPQPLSGGGGGAGGGPLRNSASADFSSASSTPLSAVDQRERAAASAAALAQAESARKKESLRLKAAEKKSQDAKALRIMKNRMYQKLFALPPSESLIEDYSCAVRKTILLHGRLYLSWNFLCFFSSIFSHKTSLIVGVADLLWANAASVALLFDNSIRIFVQNGPLPIPKIHQASGQIIPLPGAPLVVPSAYMAPAASASSSTGPGTGNANAGTVVNINTPTPPPSTSTTPAPSGTSATPTPGRERSGSNASSNASPGPMVGGPPDLSPLLSAMLAPADASAESIEALETAALAAVTPRNADREAAAAAAAAAVPSAVSAERVPAADLLASVAPASASIAPTVASAPLQAHPIVVQVAVSSDSYGDGPIATTSNASFDLNAQQLAYLIAIGHPNITMHFFASFLMRDHCLALIEGLLRKRREASPQWVAVQAAWKQIDAARAQANAIAMENAKQAAAEQKAAAAAASASAAAAAAALAASAAAAPDPLRTPPMSPLGGASRISSPPQSRPSSRPQSSASEESINAFRSLPSSPMQAAGGGAAGAAADGESLRTPSPRVSPVPQDGAAAAPLSASAMNQQDEKKSQTTFYTASSVAAAINAASVPAPLPLPPVVARLNFSAAPVPADDFRGMEWEEIVPGQVVAGLGVRAFFDAFLNDGAPWTTKSYAMAAGRGDAEWKMSSWFDAHSGAAISTLPAQPPTKLEGPWIRDCSYIKQMKDSPLGPPTTRVHQHAVYTARPDDSQIVLETRTLTPDVPFGDNLYVLERLVVEPAPEGCRVRVSVGVRFIKTPWKMKMFVTLIKSKTREDVQKWYQGWLASIEVFRKKNPQAVELAVQRGAMASASSASASAAAAAAAAGGAASTAARGVAAAPSSALHLAEARVAAIGSAALAATASLLHVSAPPCIDASVAAAAAAAAASSSAPIPLALSPTSSAELDAVAAAPSSPPVLPEWRWMRRGLSAVPGVAPHVDSVMHGVATARGAMQGFSGGELLCAGLVLLAAVLASVSQGGGASFDALLSLLLPWRWPSMLASISPSFVLMCALLLLVLLQRRSLEVSQRQIHMLAQAHRIDAERQVALQRQMAELAAQVQQILARPAMSPSLTLGPTLRVDEHHFG